MDLSRDLFAALLAGLIQGVTEWLPVSSKTLILLTLLAYGFDAQTAYLMGLVINGATAVAAIIYFKKEILEMLSSIRSPRRYREGFAVFKFLIISTILTGLVAIPLAQLSRKFISFDENVAMIVMGSLFLLTTILTWLRTRMSGGVDEVREVSLIDAVLAGFAQGLSALPGISRSGITIFTLILLGHSSRDSLRLSFLMGIPATIGGIVYSYAAMPILIESRILILTISSLTAIITSLFTISSLLKLSERLKTYLFTLILAMITLAVGVLGMVAQH
ncbi:MAG: undecaprenyl-diphosphate phosphatase [Thaumarchaeota archaeon]|nr:undecaprenyl-diphosphate phosphatase [Nitrososphaerota archaeon]